MIQFVHWKPKKAETVNTSLLQEMWRRRKRCKLPSPTVGLEIAKEEINSGTVEFEANTEELFAVNDLKEN